MNWELIIFISPPLVLLTGVWMIWLIWHKPPSEAPETAACGQCGYSTRGLVGWSCPECGSDLREVGIVPANKKRGDPDKKILWFAGLWGIVFLILIVMFIAYIVM